MLSSLALLQHNVAMQALGRVVVVQDIRCAGCSCYAYSGGSCRIKLNNVSGSMYSLLDFKDVSTCWRWVLNSLCPFAAWRV